MDLKHHFAIADEMIEAVEGVNSIDEFLAKLRKIGKRQNDLLPVSAEDPLRERNRIVGDGFEVFGEFLLKHKKTDDRVLMKNFSRPETDNGIDGVAIHCGSAKDPRNGTSVFVQFKCYQEFDHSTGKPVRLIGAQLDTFQAEVMHVLREQFPDGNIKSGWPRCLVITSAMGINDYTKETKYRGRVECFGIEALRQLTMSTEFWNDFREALGA